LVTMQKMVQ